VLPTRETLNAVRKVRIAYEFFRRQHEKWRDPDDISTVPRQRRAEGVADQHALLASECTGGIHGKW
jgi:hypothetical protein